MSAGPTLGLGAIAPGMTEEDIARLFGRMPIGAPQGFSGTSVTIVAPEAAPASASAPLSLRIPPRAAEAASGAPPCGRSRPSSSSVRVVPPLLSRPWPTTLRLHRPSAAAAS